MSLRPSKVGILKSGLKNLNGAGRNYCTKTRSLDDAPVVVVSIGPFPRRSNDILGTNPTYPFAGGIGVDKKYLKQAQQKIQSEQGEPKTFKTFSQPTTSEGQIIYPLKKEGEIIEFVDKLMRIPIANPKFEVDETLRVEVMKADRGMELKAMPCPKTMKKDLHRLFVDMELDKAEEITVLNLTQKSSTDMSAWSEEMEVERDTLTRDFINIASAICHDLQKLGDGKYWADFIEPTSGRPYFGKYTNATLFETDERFRDLGFQIEDLGCCKVVKHIKWSTHAFVGTIFTDAPLNSDAVKAILSNSESGQYFQEKPSVPIE